MKAPVTRPRGRPPRRPPCSPVARVRASRARLGDTARPGGVCRQGPRLSRAPVQAAPTPTRGPFRLLFSPTVGLGPREDGLPEVGRRLVRVRRLSLPPSRPRVIPSCTLPRPLLPRPGVTPKPILPTEPLVESPLSLIRGPFSSLKFL